MNSILSPASFEKIGLLIFLIIKSLESFFFHFEADLSFFLFLRLNSRNYSFMCRVGLLCFSSYQDPPSIPLRNALITFPSFLEPEFSLLIFRPIITTRNLENFSI